jgi:CheY-like chemotaxis protein
VTNQLLTFAKGGAPVKTSASIHELVTECARFCLSGSPVAPRFEVDKGLWSAEVDTVQIGQVVQNLVLNAMQAMLPAGGVLQISLRNVHVDNDSQPSRTPLVPGRYVCLTVKDSGQGISEEHLTRIFDPYFTTKEKGSGLGLAISYSIVRAHDGVITVDSELGVGSRFSVYLPASAKTAAAGLDARPRTHGARRPGGRVLLMDDEPMVGEVAQEMLQSLGYETELATSGQEAIERFRDAEERGEPFVAVILDLTVPGGMGGAEAVTHIKNIRADVPVVVTSGYADDPVMAHFRDYGFDAVLPKPFPIPQLRRALEELDVKPAQQTVTH